jgi:hypothetical protein
MFREPRWFGKAAGNEQLSEAADSDPRSRWINGVLICAPIPIILGVLCLVWNTAWIPGRGGGMVMHGNQAVAIGIACVAAGIFAHFHWFWSGHPRFPGVGQIGKAITLLCFSACILYVFFRFWIDFL